MSKTFTLSDAQSLPLSWYVGFLGSGLPLSRARDIKRAALSGFGDYRDQFKRWDEWKELVAGLAAHTEEAVA